MSPVSPDTSHGGLRTRRRQVRADSFGRRSAGAAARERYETPAWLERSFVLPVQHPDALDPMPQQVRPHHDTLVMASIPAPDTSGFVRPPSEEIDFARVVRLADATRLARRAATIAVALTLLALAIFLVTQSAAVLLVLAVAGAGGLAAGVALMGLRKAPIPLVRG